MTAAAGAALRAARAATRLRTRTVRCGLFLVGCAALVTALAVGEYPIPLADVVAALAGDGDGGGAYIVRTVRLPRAATGAAVGAAFGLSGALLQALARNPLASPDIVGITAGAATGAVAVLVLVGDAHPPVAAGAFAGALGMAALMYLLAWRRGVSAYRLVLVGVGLAAAATSLTSYLLTRTDIYQAQRAMLWLTGSLNARSWGHAVPVTLALAVLAPVAARLSRPLEALRYGPAVARGLGVRVEPTRAGVLLVAVGLVAAGAAAAGPVAFVAFVAPAVARRLVGSGAALLASALAGSALVLGADVAARLLLAPTELPVGVVTGLVGAPYLLWLLARAGTGDRG